ncbi:Proline iminopeptidase [invertebrate metagenome]|uniref:prolyl aminopeptidase n=1 Tax=invertebrate metagenome TaxID=1711999 RepID=A0A2H9TCP9_9ZZZZ
MRTLYPAIKPFQTHLMKMDEIHHVYVEECGNPEGIPVLFVHGGPGFGCSERDRCFFDPERYHIILFDQRGVGRSTPHAEIQNNTTALLLDDMEILRKNLGIKKWLLFGGSWGSTLSLVYAQQHHRQVIGIVLRGVFLCRQRDIDWLYKEGAGRIFPDYWQQFVEPIPEDERGNLLSAYYTRLFSDNELARMNMAKHWASWEACAATLRPSGDVIDAFTHPHTALSMARLSSHYFMNRGFLEENQILNNMSLLDSIPATVIHGRYDMVCPLDNALSLVDRWPQAELQVIRDAGHSSAESSIIDAIVRTTDQYAKKFE